MVIKIKLNIYKTEILFFRKITPSESLSFTSTHRLKKATRWLGVDSFQIKLSKNKYYVKIMASQRKTSQYLIFWLLTSTSRLLF